MLYLVLTVAVLAPGVVLMLARLFDLDVASAPILAQPLLAMQSALETIGFGSGLRFWLGFVGTLLMALLLLYPLRKMVSRTKALGSVGGWYHAHIVIGLLGPVLVLYHSNFKHSHGAGSTSPNIALWSLIIIIVSGVVGYFVYAGASQNFYADKKEADVHRDSILSALSDLDAVHPGSHEIIAIFKAFDAELLRPRQGIRTCQKARRQVRQFKKSFDGNADSYLHACEDHAPAGVTDFSRIRAAVHDSSHHYFRWAKSAADRSLREQIWARWRLFHLPVFMVLVLTTAVHIYAVWDREAVWALAQQTEASATIAADAAAATLPQYDEASSKKIGALLSTPTPVPRPQPRVAVPVLPTKQLVVTPRPVSTTTVTATAPAAVDQGAVATAPTQPTLVSPPQPAVRPPRPDTAAAPVTAPAEHAQPASKPAAEPAVQVAAPAAAPASRQSAPIQPEPVKPVVVAAPPAAEPPAEPAPIIRSAPAPIVAAPQPQAKPDAPDPIAELQRREQQTTKTPVAEPGPVMGLSGPKPAPSGETLTEQLSRYKKLMADKAFSHSTAETAFALTGKHVRVDCASCHQKPLREAASNKPRTCANCHQKDDTHNGTRPNCASCHVPTRWSLIVRR